VVESCDMSWEWIGKGGQRCFIGVLAATLLVKSYDEKQ
jgi:hypothetical protein